jgi:hypothetical protein
MRHGAHSNSMFGHQPVADVAVTPATLRAEATKRTPSIWGRWPFCGGRREPS